MTFMTRWSIFLLVLVVGGFLIGCLMPNSAYSFIAGLVWGLLATSVASYKGWI